MRKAGSHVEERNDADQLSRVQGAVERSLGFLREQAPVTGRAGDSDGIRADPGAPAASWREFGLCCCPLLREGATQ